MLEVLIRQIRDAPPADRAGGKSSISSALAKFNDFDYSIKWLLSVCSFCDYVSPSPLYRSLKSDWPLPLKLPKPLVNSSTGDAGRFTSLAAHRGLFLDLQVASLPAVLPRKLSEVVPQEGPP